MVSWCGDHIGTKQVQLKYNEGWTIGQGHGKKEMEWVFISKSLCYEWEVKACLDCGRLSWWDDAHYNQLFATICSREC